MEMLASFRQEMTDLGDALDARLNCLDSELNLTLWFCQVHELEQLLWNNRFDITRSLQSMQDKGT